MPNNMEWTRSTIAMNQTMEWTTAMTTSNHMEKTTVTIHPKIVVVVTVKKIKCNNINVNLNGDIEDWCITSS